MNSKNVDIVSKGNIQIMKAKQLQQEGNRKKQTKSIIFFSYLLGFFNSSTTKFKFPLQIKKKYLRRPKLSRLLLRYDFEIRKKVVQFKTKKSKY